MQAIGLLGLSLGLLAGLSPAQSSQSGLKNTREGKQSNRIQRRGSQRNSGARAFRILLEKYDKDGNGQISPQEYPRGEKTFHRLDRNQDGILSLDDFNRGRGFMRNQKEFRLRIQRMALQSALGTYYKKAKSIDAKAWNRFLRDWDVDQNGILEDLEAYEIGLSDRTVRLLMMAFGDHKPGRATTSLAKSAFQKMFTLLDADKDGLLTRGEFIAPKRGSGGQNPLRKGQRAPDFNLPTVHDAKKLIRLSSFIGKKPVALIFGSYT